MPTIDEKLHEIYGKMENDELSENVLITFLHNIFVSFPVNEDETNLQLYQKIVEILQRLLDYEITLDNNDKVKIRDWKYIFYSYEDEDEDGDGDGGEEPIFGNIISALIYSQHTADGIMVQYVITYLLSQGCEFPEYVASWNTGIIKKEPIFKYIISSGWIIIINHLLEDPKYKNEITVVLQDSKNEVEEFEKYISSLKNTDRYDEIYPNGDEVLKNLYKLTSNDIDA